MKQLSEMNTLYDEIHTSGTITREQALSVDKLTEGGVSAMAHPNSFTEAPSTDNVEAILTLLKNNMEHFDIKVNAEEAKNLLQSLKRRKTAIESIYRTRVAVNVMMPILSNDIKIGDESIRDMGPKRVLELSDELNSLFGKELSSSKLRVSFEDYGDKNTTVIGSVVNRQSLDTAIERLGKSITQIEKLISSDVEFTIPNKSKLFYDIQYYNNDLLYNFAEYVLGLIEDQSYMND